MEKILDKKTFLLKNNFNQLIDTLKRLFNLFFPTEWSVNRKIINKKKL